MNLIALPFIGFLIGLLIISLGGGGGVFYVGILTAFFNVNPAIAASTSLATIIPTTATGAFSHWKEGNVNFQFGMIMLIGGVLGAVAGSLCSDLLPQNVYYKITAILLLILSIERMFSYYKERKGCNNKKTRTGGKQKSSFIKAITFGVLGGVMSGLTGLSGGIPIIVGLSILGCSALETVGTSVLVLVGISITGFAMHLGLGNVDWKLVGLLLPGTMSGAFLAPILLKHINKEKMEKALQPIIIFMVVFMGIIVLIK